MPYYLVPTFDWKT